jgi:hypothetical protein
VAEPPSYQELAALRQEEWLAAQRKAEANIKALHASIAQMPDVKHAPAPTDVWGHPGIACAGCGSEGFNVTRWVTVNGVRHRAELKCLGCGKGGTWDWASKAWID